MIPGKTAAVLKKTAAVLEKTTAVLEKTTAVIVAYLYKLEWPLLLAVDRI